MPAKAGTIIIDVGVEDNDPPLWFSSRIPRRWACCGRTGGLCRLLGESDSNVLSKEDLRGRLRRVAVSDRSSSTGSSIPKAETCLLSRCVGRGSTAVAVDDADDECTHGEEGRDDDDDDNGDGILITESMVVVVMACWGGREKKYDVQGERTWVDLQVQEAVVGFFRPFNSRPQFN